MPRLLVIAGTLLALALPLAAQQQDNSSQQQQNPPAPTGTQPRKDQKDQPKKSAAQANPFPQAQSEAAAEKAQQPDSTSAPDAPQPSSSPDSPQPKATPPAGAPTKTSDQNPFPEAESERAARQARQQQNPPAPGPTRSPDDQSYSSSHVQGLEAPPSTDEQPPANLPPSPLPYNPKLAKKDANVGDFYMESGDWRGAYDRFLEANRSDPGNAEAVFGLAESARHLGHRDEALRNYRLYLSALPNGPHAKEIHKALKEMGVEP
ncbi:MAG TPA: hypothetical protein VL990_17375 [Acidobacteriaceae bacterium]|nr:hypothetical protein [Acidobacteriaceae bacterium]